MLLHCPYMCCTSFSDLIYFRIRRNPSIRPMDFVANQAGVFQRHAPLRAPRGPGAVALGEGRTRGGVEGGWGVCMAWIEGGLIWRCFVFVLCCFVFLLMFFFFFFFGVFMGIG